MGLVDTTIFALLGVALVWSIIELGLSAYAVDVTWRSSVANSRFGFLVFASLWTILVTAFFILFPMFSRRSGGGEARCMSPLTLVLNAVTMIFWLAGFAAVADMYISAPGGTTGAILAFGVMLWLIFLALLVLNVLAAFGILRSDRLGHGRLTGGKSAPPAATV
ncbi:hypothetical protein B0A52_07471 [Exophiala mesophila]|uniref:MARVEL domain-containing protein n=1 Tax=Exophiala mesophila TaxID=212818 RepID=A0A438MZR5_EXOME|nr:hypothetical protein B0A52_07471 [Exophiala mesophila]